VENILATAACSITAPSPAATFTHTGDQLGWASVRSDARALADQRRVLRLGLVRSYFKANTRPLAEIEQVIGLMKLLFRQGQTAKVLVGPHLTGSTPPNLIQESANAVAAARGARNSPSEVHTPSHPQELVEGAYKQAAAQA